MASDSQINANRENARHSTGPKTADGKASSARNSTRHGLLAREAVLPEEDPREFRDLLASLEAEFQPATPVEELLVRDMASAQWRLRRLTRIETGFLMAEMQHVRKWEFNQPQRTPRDPSTSQERYARDTLVLGHVFNKNTGSDGFGKLIRYETILHRAFYKALDTLKKFRATPLPPPAPAVPDEPEHSAPNEPNSPPAGAPETAPGTDETALRGQFRPVPSLPETAPRASRADPLPISMEQEGHELCADRRGVVS
jgi:hypothetical protein